MSRPQKIRPKTRIPGYIDGVYDFAPGVPFSDMDYSQGLSEQKRNQRIFRVKRKHVLKACDRCRVKKTKCDGKQPCNRCSTHNHPCLFRERKATQTKVYSRGFVEMLESHHLLVVKALQELYKHCVNKEGFPGEPLALAADGNPLTHAILDRLGLIKQAEDNPDDPEEDTKDLRYLRLLSTSTDSSNTTTDLSSEPVSPSDPSQSIRNTASSSPELAHENYDEDSNNSAGGICKQEFHLTLPEQYHEFPDTSYYGMTMSPQQLFMDTTNLASEIPYPGFVPSMPNYDQQQQQQNPCLYYTDSSYGGSPTKDQFPPGPSAHHEVAARLPVGMQQALDEYQGSFQEQQFYPAAPDLPGGSYWMF